MKNYIDILDQWPRFTIGQKLIAACQMLALAVVFYGTIWAAFVGLGMVCLSVHGVDGGC